MAIKGAKRPAAYMPAVRVRKRARNDGQDTRVKCSLISKALHLADVPNAVATMLANSVSSSVGVYADERHEHQTSLTEMIGKTLQGVDEKLQKSKAEASQNIDAMDADKTARADAEKAAGDSLESQRAVHAEAKAALEASSAALADAKQALSAAQAAQTAYAAELSTAASKKEKLDAATAKLQELKDAAGSSADVKLVHSMAKEVGCEAVLLKGTSDALRKAPAERGTFDNFVLCRIEANFGATASNAASVINDADASKAQHAEAVASAQTTVDAAVEKNTAAKESVRQAKEAEKEKEAALREASKRVKDFAKEMKDAIQAFDVACDKLDKFQHGALSAFKELCDKTAPQEQEAPQTAPADSSDVVAPAEASDVVPAGTPA